MGSFSLVSFKLDTLYEANVFSCVCVCVLS